MTFPSRILSKLIPAGSPAKVLALALVAASAFVLAQPARANQITYEFNTWTGTGTAPTSSPYGSVTLNDNGGQNVTVTVSLAPGEGFVYTGSGESLLWDLQGNPTVTITNLTPGFAVTNNGVLTGKMDGSGYWYYGITCYPGACGKGGSSPYTGSFSFMIDNVSLSDFVTNTKNFYFASDICTIVGDGGCMGATGDIESAGYQPPPTETPEPGALAIFGAGLLGCAVFINRRRRAARQS